MPMVDFKDSALGMIETRGLVAAIEAADAMVKTSQVSIESIEKTEAALITVHVIGETAAVQAAVDAGRAAAERVGEVLSAHVIPRPDPEVGIVLEDDRILGRPPAGTTARPGVGSLHRSGPGPTSSSSGTPTALEAMTVRELRALARDTHGFPIQGREIARANKTTLIELLRKHRS